MAASLVSMVNQRLACAQVMLAQLRGGASTIAEHALADACVFHLNCAYHHYVRELCQYSLAQNLESINSEQDARQALAQMGKTPGELEELCSLRANPHSWLSHLHHAYNACWALPKKNAFESDNIIALERSEASVPTVVDYAHLSEWLKQFTALVQRQRATSAEY